MDNKMRKYREINAMDCFYSVVAKWRIILCVTLIVTVIVGLYGVILSNKKQNDKEETAKQIAMTLTAEETKDVEDAAAVINEYREQYDAQREYNENSILQSLNALAIKEMVLEYYVDTNYRVSYPIIEETDNTLPLVMAYATLLKDDSLYISMTNSIDNSISPQYFKELVDVDEKKSESGMLSVTIYGKDELTLEKMADQIKEFLETKKDDMVAIYDDHDLNLVSQKEVTSVETEIYKKQQDNIMVLTSISNNIKGIENSFAGDQLLYLQKLVHEEIINNVSVVKYVIIGFVLGIVISLMVEIFKYILSSKVENAAELEDSFDTPILGIFSLVDVSKMGKFDRAIKSKIRKEGLVSSNDETINLIVAKFNALFGKNEKIYLLCNRSIEKSVVDKLVDQLSTKFDKKIVVLDTVMLNCESISVISNIDSVIIVAQSHKSIYDDIAEEVRSCESYGTNVDGFIVIE